MEKRIENEIQHGKFLSENSVGEIWNWEGVAGKTRWERRTRMLTTHINSKMLVLEIGCGTGYFTTELQKTNAQITAIDISPDLLKIAKQRINHKNVKFILENAYEQSFASECFDTVVGSSVLHHLDVDRALKEFYRILRKSGSIYFTEPNMMNPQIALQKNISWLKKKLGDSPDEIAFFRWDLQNKLKKYGFIKIEVIPFDFLHPKLPAASVSLVKSFGKILEKVPLIREIAGSLYIKAFK
jgi:SAM-dependent methyltransferase